MIYLTNLLLWLFMLITIFPTGVFLMKAAALILPMKKKWYHTVAAFLLLSGTCRLPSWIGDENTAFLLLFFIAVFLWCYEGTRLARIVTSITVYLLVAPLNMILDTVNRISQNWVLEEAVGCTIKTGVAFLIFLFTRGLSRKEGRPKLPERLWALCLLLGIAPLFTALSFPLWNGLAHRTISEGQLRIAYTVLPFVTLSAVALLIAIFVLSRQTELEEKNRLSGMRELYYESLRSQQAQVRTLRHDMRNHLAAVSAMLSGGETKRAQEYLDRLTYSPALGTPRALCENEIANIVLSGKLEEMDKLGLEADFLVTVPQKLSVNDADLCALLGNALDNAIEAAQRAEDKKLTLRLRADHGMLMLRVENAFSGELIEENGRLSTTKADKTAHGFGIAGMEEIARRLGGSLEAKAENGRFELVACLPLRAE